MQKTEKNSLLIGFQRPARRTKMSFFAGTVNRGEHAQHRQPFVIICGMPTVILSSAGNQVVSEETMVKPIRVAMVRKCPECGTVQPDCPFTFCKRCTLRQAELSIQGKLLGGFRNVQMTDKVICTFASDDTLFPEIQAAWDMLKKAEHPFAFEA